MQFSDEEAKKLHFSNEHGQQSPALRNPWRKLLGMSYMEPQGQAAPEQGVRPEGNLAEVAEQSPATPFLANDPWNDLLQAQNIQVVDLRQVRLHTVGAGQDPPVSAHHSDRAGQDPPLLYDDLDVEQALDMMQEETIGDLDKD